MTMKEPSVLDYFKSLIDPRKKKINISDHDVDADVALFEDTAFEKHNKITESVEGSQPEITERVSLQWPWRSNLALLLALTGQFLFEPPQTGMFPGVLFFGLSTAFLIWAFIIGEWQIPTRPLEVVIPFSKRFRVRAFYFLLPAIILSFISFIDGRYTFVNTLLWLLSIFYCFVVLWDGTADDIFSKYLNPIREFFRNPKIKIHLELSALLFLAAIGLIMTFRFAEFDFAPNEMTSDHMEFILDIEDVQNGFRPVISPRNGGRGMLFIFLAALTKSALPGLEYFSILKITSGLAGMVSLVYIYLLGKEIGTKRVGLLSMLIAGFSYWGTVISRIGLEFVLYPMLAAPTLYYLVKGFRTKNRNYFLMTGLFLGLGLHGYSAFRYMLVAVLAAVLIFGLHRDKRIHNRQVLWAVASMLMMCLIIVIPILPFMVREPGLFSYKPLPLLHMDGYQVDGAILPALLSNLWNAVMMPFWQNGDVWTIGISNRPALGVFSAALFFLGLITLVFRYFKQRNWQDLFLLISVPLLVMPSAVALAYPVENPSLARASGALVVIAVIAGLAFETLLRAMEAKMPGKAGKSLTVFTALIILGFVFLQNQQLIFKNYRAQYEQSALNTSEIGTVIRGFADSVGTSETTFVVPYPHWVDTRLVGINAGFSGKDFALWPEQFEGLKNYVGSKMIVIKPEDQDNLEKLQEMYPEGVLSHFDSVYEEKDFLIYLIPGEDYLTSN